MDLLGFLCGLSHDGLQPGDTIKVLDDTGEVTLATYKGKGKYAGGRVVVTYTQGRYTGMGQYVERERIVGPVGKKAEPGLAYHEGWKEMKEARKHIAAAVLFTLLVVGPASLIAGIVRVVSDNSAIASLVFFVAFAIGLSAAVLWKEKQTARQKHGTNPVPGAQMTVHEFIAHVNEQEQGINPIPEAQMTVHEFIAHIKMHPELLPATRTEFDLERLRKVCSKKESQAEFGDWMKQLINSATAS